MPSRGASDTAARPAVSFHGMSDLIISTGHGALRGTHAEGVARFLRAPRTSSTTRLRSRRAATWSSSRSTTDSAPSDSWPTPTSVRTGACSSRRRGAPPTRRTDTGRRGRRRDRDVPARARRSWGEHRGERRVVRDRDRPLLPGAGARRRRRARATPTVDVRVPVRLALAGDGGLAGRVPRARDRVRVRGPGPHRDREVHRLGTRCRPRRRPDARDVGGVRPHGRSVDPRARVARPTIPPPARPSCSTPRPTWSTRRPMPNGPWSPHTVPIDSSATLRPETAQPGHGTRR